MTTATDKAARAGISRRDFVGALAAAGLGQPLCLPMEDVTIVEFHDDGRPLRTVTVPKIEKSDAQWRKQLSALSYRVTREGATEPAFSGQYWETRDRGIYRCVCCNTALFHSAAKFFPGTGWASFWKAIAERNVVHDKPEIGGSGSRVACRRCDAHLGNIRNDSTTLSRFRYSIDSAAIRFFPG